LTGVYKITNIINGKVYVGESMDIDKRWDEHKLDLDNGVHHSLIFRTLVLRINNNYHQPVYNPSIEQYNYIFVVN